MLYLDASNRALFYLLLLFRRWRSRKKFWSSFHQYFSTFERKLALLALKVHHAHIVKDSSNYFSSQKLKIEEADGKLNSKSYKEVWGKWEKKEIDFYIACYQTIQKLNYKTVKKSFSEGIYRQEKEIIEKANRFSQEIIPDFLEFHPQKDFFNKKEVLTEEITLGNKIYHLNRLQFNLLQLFNGTTPTINIIRKSSLLKQDIHSLILPLLSHGYFKVN